MAKRARSSSTASTTESPEAEEDTQSRSDDAKRARPSLNASSSRAAVCPPTTIAPMTETANPPVAGPSRSKPKDAKTIKIFNMNVNGVMKAFSRRGKRLESLLKEQDPDIVVLTEMHYDPQAPLKKKEDGMAPYRRFRSRYPYQHVGVNPGASGRAGIAVFSKHKPIGIIKSGLPTYLDGPASTKGRFVQFEYEDFYLVAVYTFHSGNSDKVAAHEIRKKWDASLRQHLHQLDQKKPVICTGDQNVAPMNDDVYKATGKLSRKAIIGCILPHEREAWSDLLKPRPGTEERALIDVWRAKHPEEKKVFTHVALDGGLNFFSGFRLDHFIVSERLMPQIRQCEILAEETQMSDHVPIVMEMEASM